MASLGDSLTQASASNLPLPLNSIFLSDFEALDACPVVERDPGDADAEKRAKDWVQRLYDQSKTYSWASGEKISSHLVKIRAYLKDHGDTFEIRAENEALGGARSRELNWQARRIVATLASHKYVGLKYVTLLIGGNDICADEIVGNGTPDAKIKANILQALGTLAQIQQADPIRVLVAGLPMIPVLGDPEIRDHHTILGFRCGEFRERFATSCPNLVGWKTPAERALAVSILKAKNELIHQTALEAEALYPGLRIHYTSALENMPIHPANLAADCFHPNARGQEIISQMLWDAQPFFK